MKKAILEQCVKRRDMLFDVMSNRSVLILASPPLSIRNGDVHQPFRQNSHVLYLTGIDEPNIWVVLRKDQDGQSFHVLCEQRSEEATLWEGQTIGLEAMKNLYGANEAYETKNLEQVLPTLIDGMETLIIASGDNQVYEVASSARQLLQKGARKGRKSPPLIQHDCHWLDAMRRIKDPVEIQCIREAVSVSLKAHQAVQAAAKPGMFEYELEALFRYVCHQSGVKEQAYPPIVASGHHANILHYTQNNARIQANDYVLIDAGCEYWGYASDITRTFCVGTPSAEQVAVYDLVADTQRQVIDHIKPGIPWASLQEIAVANIVQGLLDLGLLKGSKEALIDQKAYQRFYMHQIGHWLGLDVHDVGTYRDGEGSCLLEPGMVLTVEPGIYIQGLPDIPDAWHGIGVRIEDNILVTEDGCECLSA